MIASTCSAGALLLVRIRPNRSTSLRGQMIAVGGIAAASLATAVFFMAHGYWPVAPFLGLDAAMLGFAFWAVRLSGRAYEDVIVQPDVIVIRRSDGRDRIDEYRWPTAWTRLEREDDPEFGCSALRLRHRHTIGPVAEMLSPVERAGFADALSDALARARKGGLGALPSAAATPFVLPTPWRSE